MEAEVKAARIDGQSMTMAYLQPTIHDQFQCFPTDITKYYRLTDIRGKRDSHRHMVELMRSLERLVSQFMTALSLEEG